MKKLQKFLGVKQDGLIGKITKHALQVHLKKELKQLGFFYPKSGLVELRQSNIFTNRFSDYAAVIKNGVVVEIIKWTTKPGRPGILNFFKYNKEGVGCVKEGQYENAYKYLTAKNKYGLPIFRPVKNIMVYRDRNKDNKLDKNIVRVAPTVLGFLIHPMGLGQIVGQWSLGCGGCSKRQWRKKIMPHFEHGDIIDRTIIDV